MPNSSLAHCTLIPYLVALLVAFVTTASAQQFTGTIQGTVQDPAGAVVAGAEVSVINTATNETRNVTTETDGAYVVPQLKPGFYCETLVLHVVRVESHRRVAEKRRGCAERVGANSLRSLRLCVLCVKTRFAQHLT